MPEPFIPSRSHARIAAENRAEIDGWLAERIAELIGRGMSAEDARRLATEEFGDVAHAERYANRVDAEADRRARARLWIEELGSDLRIALRTLARTPTVTVVVLLTFALGIGATTAVFSVVHAMLLRPLPYGHEESLVYLQALDNGVVGPNARFSAATVVALQERAASFSGVASFGAGNWIVSENGDPEQVMGVGVSANIFDVLEARVALGRTMAARDASESAGPVVILNDELWRRRFGADSGIIGRSIDLSNERPQVIGIMPQGLRVPTYEESQLWAPQDPSRFIAHPTAKHVRVFRIVARLKSGVSLPRAQADVDRVIRGLQTEFPRAYGGMEARVLPIRSALAGDARPRILLLMSAAAFVLIIACANVAGVLLSRAIARRHELSIRVALGAGRRRLVRHFMTEGAALALLGAGLGLLVAQLGVGLLRRVATTALPAGTVFGLEPRVLLFGLSVAVAAAFLASLAPALGATRVSGVTLRRDDGRASVSRANRRLRLGLVAGQLAVAVVLLVGTGLLLRALQRLTALDVGYATQRALTFRLPFMRAKSNAEQDVFWAAMYEQLRGVPGVAAVGGGNMPMSGQGTVVGLQVEGRPGDGGRLLDVRYSPASDDYFETLGIALIRGRVFNAADHDGAPWVGLVSAGLAKQLWPGGDPIGARVKVEADKPWVTIIGVVGDVRKGSAEPPIPTIYTSQRQDHWPGGGTVIVRAMGDPLALMQGVRQAVKRVDPRMPIIGLRTVEEFRRNTPAIADRRMQVQLLSVFALVALVVSAIGVYGVSAYATEARQREFGIRIALGASRRRVLWLALREGTGVAMVGAAAGVPIALLVASGLRELLYSSAPFDPIVVGTVLGALALVVFAASVVPARRATLIDPARTMRSD